MKYLNKVPEVILIFWLIKMMATTVGETGADFLNMNLGTGLTDISLIMGGLLIILLISPQIQCIDATIHESLH